MSTILYPSPIFGPVRSRRLGISLGINLMPADGKICTFDCIYCECGLNAERPPRQKRPTREEVARGLEAKLLQMAAGGERPDVLTFAGNGEPTSHPQFPQIIDDTLRLRDRHCPSAKVSVLSNATTAHRPAIREALLRIDCNILKLDTVDDEYIRRVCRPTQPSYSAQATIDALCSYKGKLIVQTMFLDGTHDGISVNNTGDEYVRPWMEALCRIRPQQVMIYTIDRQTPVDTLRKVSPQQLDAIAERVHAAGIPVSVSY